MREWLSGGASPCQGEGRGFDSRLALTKEFPKGSSFFLRDTAVKRVPCMHEHTFDGQCDMEQEESSSCSIIMLPIRKINKYLLYFRHFFGLETC